MERSFGFVGVTSGCNNGQLFKSEEGRTGALNARVELGMTSAGAVDAVCKLYERK